MSNFPIQAVLDGTVTAPIGNMTESLIFIGMLAQEIVNRGETVMAIEDFRNTPEYTSWLVDADNFLKYMMDNYTTEIMVAMVSLMIRDKRLPFSTQRMQNFDMMTAKMAQFIAF